MSVPIEGMKGLKLNPPEEKELPAHAMRVRGLSGDPGCCPPPLTRSS